MTRNILPVLFAATVFLAGTVLAQAPAANPQVLLKTSKGDITIELYPDKAPITVKNFLAYVDDKYYDGIDLPPRHPQLHDPGRRDDRRHAREVVQAAHQERGRQRPEERPRQRGHGPDDRARQRHLPVLHQPRGQRLPRSRTTAEASATASSARSSPAWTSSTRSPRSRPGPSAATGTSPLAADHDPLGDGRQVAPGALVRHPLRLHPPGRPPGRPGVRVSSPSPRATSPASASSSPCSPSTISSSSTPPSRRRSPAGGRRGKAPRIEPEGPADDLSGVLRGTRAYRHMSPFAPDRIYT